MKRRAFTCIIMKGTETKRLKCFNHSITQALWHFEGIQADFYPDWSKPIEVSFLGWVEDGKL